MVKNGVFIKNCLSRIFQPVTITPKGATVKKQDITSKSQRLMLELGVIHQANPGCFHFLPLGMRSLNKLVQLVDEEMVKVGGQKVIFPALINSKLWEASGRLKDATSELFQLKDRHQHDYILSPTHEESASDLIASLAPISYTHFPLRLYQIESKFRDEMKPRFGLMRGRQFLMKDMYSFDIDLDSAQKTYSEICDSYVSLFNKIGINFVKVLGTAGNIGGELSHEYHFQADIGEDKILQCNSCGYSANVELSGVEKCPQCGQTAQLHVQTGIEVGHTFFLGDKYSKPLKTNYLSKNGKPVALQMGSYGLGLTRILAATVEVLSLEQEIRWPDALAPFNAIILPPKSGSKEELNTQGLAEKLYLNLELIDRFRDNTLLDDRTSLTIGRRFLDAKRMGYRYIIVIGQKATENIPLIELNDIKTNTQLYLSESDLLKYIKENTIKTNYNNNMNSANLF